MSPVAGRAVRASADALVMAGSVWILGAAVWKVTHYGEFRAVLERHALVGSGGAALLAGGVSTLEAFAGMIGLLSLIHRKTRLGAACLAVIFFAFSGYALALFFKPPPAPAGCGCGFSFIIVHDWAALALRDAAIGLGYAACAFLRSSG